MTFLLLSMLSGTPTAPIKDMDKLLTTYLFQTELDEKASQMQVILEELPPSETNPIVVDTNPKATVATLISNYCTLKDIPFSQKYVILDEKERPLPQFSTLASLGIVDGQRLKVFYQHQSFFSRDKWPFIISFTALAICLTGIFAVSMIYGFSGGKYPNDYGVVMDAGSSKTNTLLYSWKSNKHKGTGYVKEVDSCIDDDEGIADMDPMKLDAVINCAKKVAQRVEPESRSKTPLYFAATAGMRLLREKNPERAEQILEQLRLNLTKTELSVKAIEIIEGPDEGIYGWITANFLRQTLEIPQSDSPWKPTTLGALDMGGASVQISYALPNSEISNRTDIKPMILYGQTHNLYAYSNLCFGRKEAEARYRSLLVTDISKTENEDPCSPKGYQYNITGSDLFNRTCTLSKRFAADIIKNPDIMNREFVFKGTSKPYSCQGNVSKLLDKELCSKEYGFKECFRRAHNISADQKFLAFATYFYTTNFLNVTKSSLDEFLDAAEKFCLKTKEEVETYTKKGFGKEYCFNAQYIYEVLTAGYGFTKETWKNLEFVGRISDKEVGWSLGYMINATNLIPEKGKTPKLISATALSISLALFIVLVIGIIVFLLTNHQRTVYTSSA